jgi:GWxTD domain-containing protein
VTITTHKSGLFRSGSIVAIAALLGAVVRPESVQAQTMPAQVYFDLVNRGYEKLANRISKKLELRSDPNDEDVQSLLERWVREEGGPDDGWDYIAVTRLWLRAGQAAQAETALLEAEASGDVPPPILLLDQARVAFLSGQAELAAEAYWKGCEGAGETAYKEYWLDIEVLATPQEMDEWDRFRRLPITDTDLCRFLRRFWNERALASAMEVGQRMSVHYARTRYALDHYSRRGGKKGPTFSNRLGRPTNAQYDDRGLLYVRMGAPDRQTSFAGNPSVGQQAVSAECYQPNESWAYDYPGETRVYHLSTLTGTDDYWLIENLGLVYRCGDPSASLSGVAGARVTGVLSPVNENRAVQLGPAAALVLQDLYRSRQGVDPRYAQVAQQMSNDLGQGVLNPSTTMSTGSEALDAQRLLAQERGWTQEDGEFAVDSVPDRPPVAADSRLLVEELQFQSPREGMNRVWVNAVIEADRLTPVNLPGGQFRYQVEGRWVIVDELGESTTHNSSFRASTPRVLGRDESLPVRMAADLPPGRYRYALLLRDAHTSPGKELRSGNYRRVDLTVRELGAGAPALSDVAVAADSGGAWSPGGGVRLRPSPAHLTGTDGVAYVYFEVYNLTPGGQYTTRIRLQPAEGEEGEAFDLSFPGDGATDASRMSRRMLRVDLSDSEPGRYTMQVSVTDEATGASTLPYYTPITVNRTER